MNQAGVSLAGDFLSPKKTHARWRRTGDIAVLFLSDVSTLRGLSSDTCWGEGGGGGTNSLC